MEIRPITKCRLCESQNLEQLLKLADIPLADGYSKSPRESKLYPDELWLCRECGHAQMGHMLNPEIMFTDYHFHSGDSPAFVEHLKQEGDDIVRRFSPKSVLEIGSNDETLLRHLARNVRIVQGVDPANVGGALTTRAFFTSQFAEDLNKKFDCVIANHVFAHADDLVDMVEGVRKCLSPNGVFVFENAYVLDLIRGAYYDQIYHEHPSYHSLKPLRKFFASHGMELFDVDLNGCKGGSIRGFVQHKNGPHKTLKAKLAGVLWREEEWNIHRPDAFQCIPKRIKAQKKALPRGRLIGYGAASSCTPVIYNLEIQDRLECLIDDNPRKQGLYSPGANIPVKAEMSGLPCVILALRYADAIKVKHPNAIRLP
ncbi:MAG TPA: class I SAM-dependent methyltransferase [Candidatus Binatia bacterium]|nr:class I SAM-dependent methyltransferase [Candidatus Binatia bacterium]